MEEKLSFKDLIEEYEQRTEIFNEVIQEIDVEELQKEIDNNSIDIERYKNEDSNLLLRIEELKAELNKIENIGLQYDIGNAKEECENKILEVEELREKNNSKIERLKKENEANEYNITRFNNKDEEKKKLDDEIIKEAEKREEEFNNKLLKQIEKLNERKNKYGIGKGIKQYTKEEKVVVDKIQEEIDGINKQIEKNKIMLKYFKENLGKNKKRTTARKEEKISHKPEEPEQTEPEQTEPEQTEPEQTEPEQTEPEQTKPEQTKPEQTKPEQTEPVQPKPAQKTTSQPVQGTTTMQTSHNKQKLPITFIGITPNGRKMEVRVGNEPAIKGKTFLEYKSDIEQVEKILDVAKEKIGEEVNIDKNYKKLDPNILIGLKLSGNEDTLYKYIKAVCGKGKSELPFELEYNLEGISYLDKEQRKNIKKIAKRAKKLGATVNKEKFTNKIKAMLKSNEKLLLEEKYEKYLEEKNAKFTQEEIGYGLTKEGKKTMRKIDRRVAKLKAKREEELKHPKPKHLKPKTSKISKVKSIATSLGKETIGGLKIAGTRISGYFKGENPIVTNNKVRAIREKSFVQKVSIDHQKAQQNATEKAADPQQSKQTTR